MIIAIVLAATAAFSVYHFLIVLIENYNAHKFFEKTAPNLTVVPSPNLLAGHALSIIAPNKNWKIIQDLHKQYGPTFGYYMIGQPWVSTMDIELIKLIELDQGYKHLDRPFIGIPMRQFNQSILQLNGHRWQRTRKSLAPHMTNIKVKSANATLDIELCVNRMRTSLEKKLQEARRLRVPAEDGDSSTTCIEIDAGNLANRFATSVLFTIFYKLPNEIDFDAPKDIWVERITQMGDSVANPLTYAGMCTRRLRALCEFVQSFTMTGRLQQEMQDFVSDAMGLRSHQKRRAMSAEEAQTGEVKLERGLIDSILDSFFDRKVPLDEISSTLFMLLMAAVTTTADTLTCMLWLLAKNQDVQEKLRRVICQEGGVDDEYVMWCINETVRFHTAVPLATGRVLGEDISFKGLTLAKGTFIMPTTHGIHHDPSIWPEPERYNPDRWREQANFHPAQFIGFGLGPRNCPGGKLGVQEIKLALRVLLAEYRFECCEQTAEKWDFSAPGLFWCNYDEPVMLRLVSLSS